MITATSRSLPEATRPTIQRPQRVPRKLRHVELTGPAGQLEAVINEGDPHAPYAALVCHPHPIGGGTMHNKVVYHAMKVLNAPDFNLGFPVLRFNFRGTGLSEGAHDGQAEAADVDAALRWLGSEYGLPIIVVGFSFGAVMALAACCASNHLARPDTKIKAIAALGLPVRSGASAAQAYDYSFLAGCAIPKLFLSGDHDQYAPPAELRRATATAPEPKQVVLIPGADHFFNSRLEAMQTALASWLKEFVI